MTRHENHQHTEEHYLFVSWVIDQDDLMFSLDLCGWCFLTQQSSRRCDLRYRSLGQMATRVNGLFPNEK